MVHIYNSTLIIVVNLKCARFGNLYDSQDWIKTRSSGPCNASRSDNESKESYSLPAIQFHSYEVGRAMTQLLRLF